MKSALKLRLSLELLAMTAQKSAHLKWVLGILVDRPVAWEIVESCRRLRLRTVWITLWTASWKTLCEEVVLRGNGWHHIHIATDRYW